MSASLTVPSRSWVLCPNGHRICFCESGIKIGSSMNSWADKLTQWQQPEPKVGTPFLEMHCEKCDASYWPFESFEAADA